MRKHDDGHDAILECQHHQRAKAEVRRASKYMTWPRRAGRYFYIRHAARVDDERQRPPDIALSGGGHANASGRIGSSPYITRGFAYIEADYLMLIRPLAGRYARR